MTNDNKWPTIDRRSVIAGGLGLMAAPAVLRVIPANAQSKAVKLGLVSPHTGPLAGFGEADAFILDQVKTTLAKGLADRRQDLSDRDRRQGQPVQRHARRRGRV